MANDFYQTEVRRNYNPTPDLMGEISSSVHVLTGFKGQVTARSKDIADLLILVAKGELLQYPDESFKNEERLGKGSLINSIDFFSLDSFSSPGSDIFVIPDSIHNKLDGVFILILDKRAFMQSVFKMDKARYGQHLSQMPLLAGSSRDDVQHFSLHSRTVNFEQGDVILKANDINNAECFFIISGFVGQNSESTQKMMGPAEYFGHDSISSPSNAPSPHSFVAITQAFVLKVELSALMKSQSAMKMLNNVAKRHNSIPGDHSGKSHSDDHHSPRHSHHSHHDLKDLVGHHRYDIAAVNEFSHPHHHRHRKHHIDDNTDEDFSMPVGGGSGGQSVCSLESVLWWIPGLYPAKPS